MWLGQYMQGQRLPLSLVTRNGSGTAVQPDRCPTARIYNDAGTLVTAYRLPVADRYGQTAFFQFVQLMDGRFAVGRLRIVYLWSVSSVNYSSVDIAEVTAGGDPEGAGVSMFVLDSPVGQQVLVQSEKGNVTRRRNPRMQ